MELETLTYPWVPKVFYFDHYFFFFAVSQHKCYKILPAEATRIWGTYVAGASKEGVFSEVETKLTAGSVPTGVTAVRKNPVLAVSHSFCAGCL